VSARDKLSPDVDAFMHADERFSELCGPEADGRWSALGAPAAGSLAERQLATIARVGATAGVIDALAWEIKQRIALLDDARRSRRSKK
jgi:hypothetical protein